MADSTQHLYGGLAVVRDTLTGKTERLIDSHGNPVISEVVHKSVFNLTDSPITLTDDAGAGQYGSIKLGDFPAGNIITLGATIDASLTLNESWWTDTAEGDVGLGTVAGSDATTLDTTRQNIIATTAIAAMTDQAGPVTAQSTGVATTGVAAGTDADCVLNIRIDDAAGHMPDVVTNGAFTTDASWTKGAGWTVDNANDNVAAATTASTALSQAVALVPGVSYELVFTTTRSAGSVRASVGGTLGTARSTTATFTETIVAGSNGVLAFTGTGFTGTLDDVYLTPLTGTGKITGTVTVVWLNAGDIA